LGLHQEPFFDDPILWHDQGANLACWRVLDRFALHEHSPVISLMPTGVDQMKTALDLAQRCRSALSRL